MFLSIKLYILNDKNEDIKFYFMLNDLNILYIYFIIRKLFIFYLIFAIISKNSIDQTFINIYKVIYLSIFI